MRYKPYPKYKDSGVVWLGDVPEGWEVMSLKLFTSTIKGFAFKSNDFKDIGIPIIKTTDIKNNTIKNATIFMEKEISRKYTQVKVRTKDIILSTVGSHPRIKNSAVGQIGIVPSFHNNSLLNQNAVIFKPNKLFMINDYFPYLLRSSIYREHLDLYAHGTANQASLSLEDMLKYKTCIPPLKEQTQIANYLDQKTTKIDTLIEKQQTLIKLLKEKRQALISHAVTKGLDDSVAMKDSGVEWLGDVPEGWEIKKLKHIGQAIIGLTYSPSNIVDENEGTLVLRSSNLQNGGLYYGDNVYVNSDIPDKLITKNGDIVICSRNGSRKLIGKNAMIDKASAGVSFGAFTSVFRSNQNPFVFYILNSSLFKYQSGRFMTTTINQLTTGTLNEFQIALPSENEQSVIVKYLVSKTQKIDTLINKATQAIELLKERRTALISAVVTGKVDVREENCV
jgi:type I restriction enzyme S subunit